MIWTKTPPTKPGLYYWRTHDGDNKLRCREIWQGIYQLVVETGIPLEEYGGEWGCRVPKPGTTFTVDQTADWILGEQIHDGNGNTPKEYEKRNKLIRFLAEYVKDKEDGIEAVTERNKKE